MVCNLEFVEVWHSNSLGLPWCRIHGKNIYSQRLVLVRQFCTSSCVWSYVELFFNSFVISITKTIYHCLWYAVNPWWRVWFTFFYSMQLHVCEPSHEMYTSHLILLGKGGTVRRALFSQTTRQSENSKTDFDLTQLAISRSENCASK